MGLRIACFIAQRISDALMFAYRQLQYEGVNYLDDLASAEIVARVWDAYRSLENLLRKLGIWEALSKSCEPTSIMIFLGILFNTLTMTLEITPDRLHDLMLELNSWLGKKQATLKQVQSLASKLNFAAATV